MRLRTIAALLGLGATAAQGADLTADFLTVCNDIGMPNTTVDASVITQSGSSFRVAGWWTAAPGKCTTIRIDGRKIVALHWAMHVSGGQGEIHNPGEVETCVHPVNKFDWTTTTLDTPRRCPSGMDTARFAKVNAFGMATGKSGLVLTFRGDALSVGPHVTYE